ncbi:hypothetical protein [Bacillus sp. Marseille-P3661]|uniref:hypothetical protein n=1 Tax=Bacillus sp. Marseille-P3661 TaxID=1936234 RepID=UPI000C85F927|nr:hypothetical protein [Bacillus sp. Marseille-P3661]
MKLGFIFSIILFLLVGCSSKIVTTNASPNNKPLDMNVTNLSQEDKESLKMLSNYIQEGKRVMEELDILITEFQKEDALDDALDAMVIAKQELELLLNKTALLQTKDAELQEFINLFSKKIEHLIDGLKFQIDGISNGDSQLVQEGYELTEQFKLELYNLGNQN